VSIGVLLLYLGSDAVRLLWFPLAFLAFMVPIPEAILDAVTGPLKQSVSLLAEGILYAAGYPVGRTGVMLTVGQYQLLVADACSGLNSMYSLTALGLLYLYLMGHAGFTRNALLIAAILPIAFVANVVRVIFLVLITYHFGDAAGQGFIHGFSGMVLFVVALLSLILLDSALGMVFRRPAAGRGARPAAGDWRQEAS
jgi:exosortase B